MISLPGCSKVAPWRRIGHGRDAVTVVTAPAVPVRPPDRPAQMIRPEPGNARGAAAPLVSLPYGTATPAQKPRSRLRIYPSGCEIQETVRPSRKPPDTDKTRGKITTFSARSSMRMREFLMTHEVPKHSPYGITLTDRADSGADDFRRYLDLLGKRVKRLGWAIVWRIELHATGKKCGLPHLHGTFWAPNDLAPKDVRRWLVDTWLEIIGRTGDLACRRHAVRCKPLEGAGWFAYQAAHDTKHKEEQLGWQGKQWGVINRDAFRKIVPDEFEFTDAQDKLFRRWWNRLLKKRGARVRVKSEGTSRRLGTARSMHDLARWVQESVS